MSEFLRPLTTSAQNERGNRVEIVGYIAQAQTSRFKRYASASRCHVQYQRIGASQIIGKPLPFVFRRIMRKGPFTGIARFESYALLFGDIQLPLFFRYA